MNVLQVAKEMSDSAEKTLGPFCSGVPITIQSVKETDDKAFGNGVAIVYEYKLLVFLSFTDEIL